MTPSSASRLIRVLLALFASHVAAFAQGKSALVVAQLATVPHVPNEVLVQYRAGATEAQKRSALARISGTRDSNVVNSAWRRDGLGDLDLVRLPPGLSVAAGILGLQSDSAVAFAEPNWIYQHFATSNDAYYTNGSLWGLYGSSSSPANQFGSGAAAAWAANKTGSSTVIVGIIDEGVQINHSDLAANIWKNTAEIAGNGRDDDGNGLVDDINGWDFAGNNNTVYDGTADDHGTHVAGTIGAVGGNGAGVAGVCWNVKMIPVKFLGATGGTTANAIKAVDYLTDLKTRHNLNLVASNNSWGGGGFSQPLFDAIGRANMAGILFVAAAGNASSNNDAVANYPSNYNQPNIIAVAAITSSGALASYSNFGATQVDIGAPGSGIWSTVPGSRKTPSSYASYDGTSMATPHVTGACALYASINPGATAEQIRTAILNSATPTSSLSGKTVTGGRLNVSGF